MSEVQVKQGHPKGLWVLFMSEMWERFCYYGMRTILTLYLIKSLFKGDADASILYGAYTGLVYAAPVIGGRLADQIFGYRYAIMLGAILMAIGEFFILGGNETWLFLGMGGLIIGNGLFKANISTIVGKLYEDGDPRRDSGFTIFYIGINIGAALATGLVGVIGETYGFEKGFALAGFGMLLGLLIFYFGREKYAEAEGVDIRDAGLKKIAGNFKVFHLATFLLIIAVPLLYFLLKHNEILNWLFLSLFIFVASSLIMAGAKEGPVYRDRMIALVIFIMINIVFWACFEQAGTSLTLFADRNVDREILGWVMPASMTQFFNPLFIIIFGFIFSVMWIRLTKKGRNPSIPIKFALGIFQLGLGFLVTLIALNMESGFKVPLLTLVFLYLLHTTGELFLSPIGLSMVTKLAPKHIVGTAMGGWFLSYAIANFLAGQIAALTGTESDDRVETNAELIDPSSTVMDGFVEMGNEAAFENWTSLSGKMSKNITISKYLDVQDWVQFRTAVEQDLSYSEWLSSRKLDRGIGSFSEWLKADEWSTLGKEYDRLTNSDKEALKEDKGTEVIDLAAWLYFREGLGNYSAGEDPLNAVFSEHKLSVLEKGLNKYVSIFSTIGFTLLGIALLIALLSKPLNKLMHGVV